MPRLLAIDTSSQACSVALNDNGSLIEEYAVIPRLHARQVLPMVERLMNESGYSLNELDGIAFANGPGSFTGIRIATGVAQGLAFGSGLPVLPVSSLAVLAQTYCRENDANNSMVVIDARMNQVYWGCYSRIGELVELKGEEGLSAPETIVPETISGSRTDWVGVGDGWKYADYLAPEILANIVKFEMECYPHAQDAARLAMRDFNMGHLLDAAQAQPNYLRGKNAWKKSAKS